jgi:RHS repeat-associated protein
VTVTKPLTVTVQDTDGAMKSGIKVYAFNGTTYTNYSGTTNADGQTTFTLPQGNYRFRADLNGTQFWSGASNHCALPGCESANVIVTIPLSVTVQTADGTPQAGIKVYAFNGSTYTNYSGTTNTSGQATFTLPQGNYRFRADYGGAQYWSSTSNHCTLPGCTAVTVTVGPQPTNTPTPAPTETPLAALPDGYFNASLRLPYAYKPQGFFLQDPFTDTPTASPTLTASPTATFTPTFTPTPLDTLTPTLTALPTLPAVPSGQITIDYDYDPLYRLTSADYSTGDYYHYTYDSVGNRLSETTQLGTKNYVYDDANRLSSVDGVNYAWDANGNLLNDGVNAYVYDSANRLTSVSNQSSVSSYQYNGLGDRLTQTVNSQTTNYVLDINAGLTQVLDDGTNVYAYGLGRISQLNTDTLVTDYFLGDALGSARQLTAGNGDVTLAKSYDPYGNVTRSAGSGTSPFAYTGEQQDGTGLTYLRARYYNPAVGRFMSRDTWGGSANSPMSFNRWNYVDSNPVNAKDPTGHIKETEAISADSIVGRLKNKGIVIKKDWGIYITFSTIDPLSTFQCGWLEGNWELKELRWTEEAILDLTHAMHGSDKLTSVFNGVTINRTTDILKRSPKGEVPGYSPPVGSSIIGNIVLQDYNFSDTKDYAKFTIVHEFGHVWDYRTGKRLSSELMQLTGGWVCVNSLFFGETCFVDTSISPIIEPSPDTWTACVQNPTLKGCEKLPYSYDNTGGGEGTENWAQALAYYVYDGYNPDTTGLHKIRRQYVKKQIANIR